ncbi:RidA family protein [Rhodococcus erythropolis]|uniref:RidA family protein n=1 Tax=Rhodococcus erythropolis TaxID=1833 RepID=UPI001E6437C4|nr:MULTISPECIES: RidA family protein [Rhodococcus erythropolis group]MCD2109413.1 RidA family protein [Rhodococcus qingshengii]MCZ4527404.1 RidA family protein [Rhodococcus erythropolis]
MPPRTMVSTPGAPPPAGHYSQAAKVGSLVQVSGQMGFDPTDFSLAADVFGQTTRTLSNIDAILRAAGSQMSDVVMLRVYLASLSDFAEMNEALEPWFPSLRPARTTVQVTLPDGVLIEIDALAVAE